MATISELNIRLGLLTREFDRNLRKVERDLRGSASRLSELGTDLTLAISAPLAALGAAALKNAGEIEALKLAMVSTFESAGRSAGEALTELDALRKSALAPGLDFEQAVRGSIRLQGVGQSAEEARKTLEAMANAIALTGGTSKELDGVTRQFAQIIAKGRVLQEDVTILAENMPKISALMQRAFGTTSVEAIRKAGVTGKEFVERITAAAQELPKVEGGIKNAFVNAAQAARIALARLGEEINKTFDVSATLDRFINVLDTLVNAFASLSDQSKKTIISVAGLLIAVGPLTAIVGRIGTAMATAISFAGGLLRSYKALALTINAGLAPALLRVHALTTASIGVKIARDLSTVGTAATAAAGGVATLSKSVATMTAVTAAAKNVQFAKTALAPIAATAVTATGGVSGLTGAVRIFSVAMRTAFAVGAVGLFVAAIVSAVEIFRAYNKEASRAAAVQETLAENTRRANDSITEERVKVEQLAAVLKDNTATRSDQLRALKTLQGIAPDYFGKLDLEKSKVQDIDFALKGYIDSLLKAARAQAAFEQITEIEKRLNNLKEEADPSFWERAGNAILGFGSPLHTAALNARTAASNMADLRAELEAQRTALVGIIKDNGGVARAVKNTNDALSNFNNVTQAGGAAAEAASKRADLYKDALASIAAVVKKGDVLGADVIGEQAKEIENQIERLIEGGFKPYSAEITHLRGMLVDLRRNAQVGFFTPNATLAALAELDKVNNAIQRVTEVEIPINVMSAGAVDAIGSINRALDLLDAQQIVIPFSAEGALEEFGRIEQAAGQLKGLDIPVLVSAKDALAEIVKVEQAISRATQGLEIGPLVSAPLTIAEIEKIERAGAGIEKIEVVDTEQAKAAIEQIERIDAAIKEIRQRTPVDLINLQPGTGMNLPQIPTLEIPEVRGGGGMFDAAAASLASLREEYERTTGASEQFVTATQGVLGVLQGMQDRSVPVFDAFGQMADIVQSRMTPAMQAFSGVAVDAFAGITEAVASGAVSFRSFAAAVIQSTARSIGAILKLLIAQLLLKSAFFAANPFVALAIGGIVGGLASALFQRLAKKISAPALAEGGVVKKPTLALIGEYQGAASNPEIVAPEQKLRQIFRSEMGGGMPYILSTNISGSDIQIVLERAGVKTRRIRGF